MPRIQHQVFVTVHLPVQTRHNRFHFFDTVGKLLPLFRNGDMLRTASFTFFQPTHSEALLREAHYWGLQASSRVASSIFWSNPPPSNCEQKIVDAFFVTEFRKFQQMKGFGFLEKIVWHNSLAE